MLTIGKRLKSLLSLASKILPHKPPDRKHSKKKKFSSRMNNFSDKDLTNYVLIAGTNSNAEVSVTEGMTSQTNSLDGSSQPCFSFEAEIRSGHNAICSTEGSPILERIEDKRLIDTFNSLRKEEFVNDGRLRKKDQRLFKIMNYNVLSQSLLEFHPYLYVGIPHHILRWKWRFPRILAEIASHDPDVLCLQEVQHNHLANFTDSLEPMGYKGVYKRKTGGKFDGCAIFYKTKRFDMIDAMTVKFYRQGVGQLNRDNIGLAVKLRNRPLCDEDNCSSATVEDTDGGGSGGEQDLVVATTHLLFNPKRHEVRLAQLQLFLAELYQFTNWSKSDKRCSLILTGDFNSYPDSVVVDLIMNGRVNTYYPPLPPHSGVLPNCTLVQNQTKDSGLEESKVVESPMGTDLEKSSPNIEFISNGTLSHHFNFRSAYKFSSRNGTAATTFQGRWVTVDYIFYTFDRLKLVSNVRLLTSDECEQIVGQLPNVHSPSDHFPLIATFTFDADNSSQPGTR
ncbi:hypothetical protein AAG570_008788 [Ranatra chinensis]|uniref:Endonuclease/exonuclease/phosphatase domain-containing protein n=1 Tax=Ranatra chinensis TaxID=642074 RepID=A0ABD0YSK7_9HEMI